MAHESIARSIVPDGSLSTAVAKEVMAKAWLILMACRLEPGSSRGASRGSKEWTYEHDGHQSAGNEDGRGDHTSSGTDHAVNSGTEHSTENKKRTSARRLYEPSGEATKVRRDRDPDRRRVGPA